MPPFGSDDSPIDLSDLKREASALLADFERAERDIEARAAERAGAPKPAPAGETAMTDAMIDGDYGDGADDEPAAESVAPDPVGEQVDALIEDAVSAVEALDEQISGGDAPDAAEGAVETAAHAVDALVEETTRAATGAGPVPPDAEDEPVPAAPDQAETSEAAVASDDSRTEASADRAEPDEPASLEALDATIESEADDLAADLDDLEGEFESPEEIADAERAQAEPSAPVEAKPVEAAPAVDSPFANAPAPTPPAPAEPAAEARPAGPAPEPAASDEPPARSLLARLTALPRRAAGLATPERLETLRARVLEPLSAPLRRLSPQTRDLIGWVGVNTLFIALCLWLFLLVR